VTGAARTSGRREGASLGAFLRRGLRRPRVLGLGAAAALGIATIILQTVQAIASELEFPLWLSLTLIAAAAVATGGGLAGQEFQRRSEHKRSVREAGERQRQDEQAKEERISSLLKLWPLPTVASADPFDVGVHRSQVAERLSGPGTRPQYVRREVDDTLVEALETQRFVLLKGGASEGKSRTAFEAAARACRNSLLIAPHEGSGVLSELFHQLGLLEWLGGRAALLWLDGLEHHLDLNARLLAILIKAPVVVLATINDTPFAEYLRMRPDVLREFRRIQLPSLKPAERTLAGQLYPGAEFIDSIGGYFMSEQELLHRLTTGNTECSFERRQRACPVSQAIIEAAVDWARTGLRLRPISADDLKELSTRYLRRDRPSLDVAEEHYRSAFSWTIEEVAPGVALLEVIGESRTYLSASERVVQWLEEPMQGPTTAIPQQAWDFVLDRVNEVDAAFVMLTAYLHENREAGDRALSKATETKNPKVIPVLELAASLNAEQSPPETARLLYERVLALKEGAYGRDDPEMVIPLRGLAGVLVDLGNPLHARRYLERALKIQRRVQSSDQELVETLRRLAFVLEELGEPHEAWRHLERALQIQERIGAPEEELDNTIQRLAMVLNELGRPKEAQGHLERILRRGQEVYGPDHPALVAVMDNLGNVYYELGEFEQAYDLQHRALVIAKEEHGPRHERVAGILNNLGNAASRLGHLKEAQGCYARALAITKRTYGADHPDYVLTLGNLANLLARGGEPEQARRYYERALQIERQVYGDSNPRVANTLNNLANLLDDVGEPDESRLHLEQALQIELRVYGQDHPRVGLVQNNLGVLMSKLERHEDAERYFWQALRAFVVTLGPRHHRTNMARRNLYPYLIKAMDEVAARLQLRHPLSIADRQLIFAQPWLLRIADRNEEPGVRSIDRHPLGQPDEETRAS
jgi:tetratricopeptide (TPR) repeat protein